MFKSTWSLMTAMALLISAWMSAPVAPLHPTAPAPRLSSAPESPGDITSFPDASSANAWSLAGSVTIVDDLVITSSVTLEPGVYNLLDVNHDGLIQIAGDNITLDGSGVFINGMDSSGYGIVMNGHSGLTLSHFDIRGFNYGIDILHSTGVTIEN